MQKPKLVDIGSLVHLPKRFDQYSSLTSWSGSPPYGDWHCYPQLPFFISVREMCRGCGGSFLPVVSTSWIFLDTLLWFQLGISNHDQPSLSSTSKTRSTHGSQSSTSRPGRIRTRPPGLPARGTSSKPWRTSASTWAGSCTPSTGTPPSYWRKSTILSASSYFMNPYNSGTVVIWSLNRYISCMHHACLAWKLGTSQPRLIF